MAVVNALTKDSVIILGFSDGAYRVASMYPERIKKMIAVGAGEQIPDGLKKINCHHWHRSLIYLHSGQKWNGFDKLQ